MKSSRLLSIAILMSVTGAAFADGPIHCPGDITFVPGNRPQVAAELREAKRLGLVANGEREPVATAEQERMIREAGLQAVEQSKQAAQLSRGSSSLIR